MKCYVGVDTSNYTTSVGIVDADGGIIANVKRLLPVADGACGLRQSDAVFAHVKNLPLVFREAAPQLEDVEILGIGYSARAMRKVRICRAFFAARRLPRRLPPGTGFRRLPFRTSAGMFRRR